MLVRTPHSPLFRCLRSGKRFRKAWMIYSGGLPQGKHASSSTVRRDNRHMVATGTNSECRLRLRASAQTYGLNQRPKAQPVPHPVRANRSTLFKMLAFCPVPHGRTRPQLHPRRRPQSTDDARSPLICRAFRPPRKTLHEVG
jgi:hypothetical protein